MAQNGKKTKLDIIKESMNAPKKIDTSIDFRIPRSSVLYNPKKHECKCLCCGKGFVSKKNNFQKSFSPLFQENDGYLPWCKECSDKYYSLLCSFYSGNEEHAIEHFCQQADWVFDINPLMAARDIESSHRDRTRLSHYAAKKNLNVNGRKTYIDTLKNYYENKQHEIILSKEQVKTEETTIPASAIDRWGIGFTETDYKNLDEHYRLIKKNNPNADNNQEIFIKSLSNLNNLMIKALQKGDSKEYTSLVEQYSKTFKQAGLKTVEEKDSSTEDSFGFTLGIISQYTPEEFYLDKKLYEDYDSIGEYYDRFVKRPTYNLLSGSDTRDYEFFVPEGDDDEGK